MRLPNVIHPPNYIAPLSQMAWTAAGWRAVVTDDGAVESWGPSSIIRAIGLDVLDLTGCLDAKL